ncbi:MAG: DUF4331 family protein [Tepidisphaeraceae bacterium]
MRRLAVGGLALSALFAFVPQVRAADHGDAPLVSQDQGADIGDCYLFLDPNDNSKIVMAFDVHGFIVPGENANFGNFDSTIRFRFNISNTNVPAPDMSIDVTFSPLVNKSVGQIATVRFSTGQTFQAPATPSDSASETEPTRIVTTDPATGVSFFAGLTDDPFFFDVPAFDQFLNSVNAGAPNPAVFNRGRDSFAGYNINMIAMDVPLSLVRGAGNNTKIGLFVQTQRRATTVLPPTTQPLPTNASANGTKDSSFETLSGNFVTLDRLGIPAVNIVFIPLNLKDEYNRSTPLDDAAGKFAPYIIATAQHLGVDQTHIGVLASLAVSNGDYLRLDTTIANTGPGGGNNAAAAFPNGRRPQDDVITTLLTVINNGAPLSDNVPANDVPFKNIFPFYAKPHQPLPAGATDDTKN